MTKCLHSDLHSPGRADAVARRNMVFSTGRRFWDSEYGKPRQDIFKNDFSVVAHCDVTGAHRPSVSHV